ncbi:MAG: NYN domain-containing protein [Microthrixaceae bacterium]
MPKPLRPLIRFKKLPSKALRTVREVLDQDAEFRERVVDGVNEGDLDRASWLFLARPEGWREEYELLVAAMDEQALERESRSAERRLENLEANYGRTKLELADARRQLKSLETLLDNERAEHARLVDKGESLVARIAELEAERGSVIRNLKTAELLSVERLARIRALEAELEEATTRLEAVAKDVGASVTEPGSTPVGYTNGGSEGPGSMGSGLAESRSGSTSTGSTSTGSTSTGSPSAGSVDVDPVAASSSIAEAIRALAEIGVALDKAALALGAASDDASTSEQIQGSDLVAPEPGGTSLVTSDSRPARRTPIRLLRGALDGSRAGIEQILTTPGVVVYVDGYNVSMEAWPSLTGAAQRQSLIDMLGSIAARTRAEIHAVFDGDSDGRRPTVSSPLPVRVHFSHEDVEADDQILGYVRDLAPNRPVMVISSDNRVRTGARRLGANTITSSELLAFARGTAG